MHCNNEPLNENYMDVRKLVAPCGIPCFACVAYKAKTSSKLQKLIANRMDMHQEDARCDGCRKNNGTCFLASGNKLFPHGRCSLMDVHGRCIIYACVQGKNLHNCSECGNFPCEHLHPMADKASEMYHNLKCYNLGMIRKLGLENWAQREAAESWKKYMTLRLER